MGSVTRLVPGRPLDDFQVKCVGSLELPDQRMREIEAGWSQRVAENPTIFNGTTYFFREESPNCLCYQVVRSDYATYLTSTPEDHLYLVNVVTVLVGVDFYCFGVARQGSRHAGKIVPVGGMLDDENMGAENPFFHNYAKEIEEEMCLDVHNLEHISSYEVAYLGRRESGSVELIVKANTPLSQDQLIERINGSDHEFEQLFFLPRERSAIEGFLLDPHQMWENLKLFLLQELEFMA